jgi:plastocyanin
MKTHLTGILMVLGAVLAGPSHAQGDERQEPTVVPVVDGVQAIRIEGGSYYFRPDRLLVHVNVPVELTVSVKAGLASHNWVIHAPEAGMDIEESLSTTPKTIRFTPTAVGKYPFYCNKKIPLLKSHRERGMEGVIEVVP